MSAQPERRLFSVAEYERMVETAILAADDHVELIEGDVVRMSPIGSRHNAAAIRLTALLGRAVDDGIIQVQGPIRLTRSVPQPDLAVLKGRADFYESAYPEADDVRFVVEVADSTLAADRTVKARLYGQAGIETYWLINLVEATVEVHSEPGGDGYGRVEVKRRGESVRAAGVEVQVNAILG